MKYPGCRAASREHEPGLRAFLTTLLPAIGPLVELGGWGWLSAFWLLL